jgi:hypothetical protein
MWKAVLIFGQMWNIRTSVQLGTSYLLIAGGKEGFS